MKNSIRTIAIFLITTNLAHADTTNIIKALAQRFQRSKQPDLAELIKHTYQCTEVTTFPNPYGNGNELLNSFEFKVGTTSIGTLAYRVDSNGDLLGEWSVDMESLKLELNPIAAAPVRSKILSYILCNIDPYTSVQSHTLKNQNIFGDL